MSGLRALADEIFLVPRFLRAARQGAGALFLATCIGAFGAPDPAPSDPAAAKCVSDLKMHVLPRESGYLSLIATSGQKVAVGGASLAVQSQVYYLLTRELPVNYLHWLASDDTHILLDGGPVDYFIFHPDG
jgi:uncharacterized protein